MTVRKKYRNRPVVKEEKPVNLEKAKEVKTEPEKKRGRKK